LMISQGHTSNEMSILIYDLDKEIPQIIRVPAGFNVIGELDEIIELIGKAKQELETELPLIKEIVNIRTNSRPIETLRDITEGLHILSNRERMLGKTTYYLGRFISKMRKGKIISSNFPEQTPSTYKGNKCTVNGTQDEIKENINSVANYIEETINNLEMYKNNLTEIRNELHEKIPEDMTIYLKKLDIIEYHLKAILIQYTNAFGSLSDCISKLSNIYKPR